MDAPQDGTWGRGPGESRGLDPDALQRVGI